MLTEISGFRHYAGHANRRFFTDSDMDLYVWFNEGAPERFHLTFNKQGCSRSLSWNNEIGFEQGRFAQVEATALILGFSQVLEPFFTQDKKDTPAPVLAHRFLCASDHIAPWLADFIYARLLEYPGRDAMHINQGTVLSSF